MEITLLGGSTQKCAIILIPTCFLFSTSSDFQQVSSCQVNTLCFNLLSPRLWKSNTGFIYTETDGHIHLPCTFLTENSLISGKPAKPAGPVHSTSLHSRHYMIVAIGNQVRWFFKVKMQSFIFICLKTTKRTSDDDRHFIFVHGAGAEQSRAMQN